MSCIVGFVEHGVVFLDGDSAGTAGYQQTLLSIPKVFCVGEATFGCVGDFRMMQLLHYALELPSCAKTVDLSRYMATDFANARDSHQKQTNEP